MLSILAGCSTWSLPWWGRALEWLVQIQASSHRRLLGSRGNAGWLFFSLLLISCYSCIYYMYYLFPFNRTEEVVSTNLSNNICNTMQMLIVLIQDSQGSCFSSLLPLPPLSMDLEVSWQRSLTRIFCQDSRQTLLVSYIIRIFEW